MWRLARLEWVYNSDAQLLEVAFASRSDDQVMNARRGSNHGIFQESIRSPVHDSTPLPETLRIHREYLIRSC
jgi:hypothetical protein